MNTLKELLELQNNYAKRSGGYSGILEADDFINSTNIEIIKAFQREKGTAFLVETYKGITEYTGQRIYNFCCNFLIPKSTTELERLCIEGNIKGLQKRVKELGGICMVWY